MQQENRGALSGRKVLVTGGYGLVGSAIVRHSLSVGMKVQVIDAMFREMGGNEVNLEAFEGQFDFLKLDYSEIDDWSTILADVDFVFHMAAQISHMESMSDPERDLRINQLGFLRLLEAVKSCCPEAHVLVASTRQIYGRPDRLPVDESHALKPPDLNAVHQIAAENYLQVFAQSYGLKSTVLRLTNTYGPGMRIMDARQTFVGIWLRRLLEGKPFEVWGRDTVRDLTFVDDCADAFLRAAGNNKAIGRVYNLGGDMPITLGELADLLVSLGVDGSYVVKEIPDERRKIDIGNFYADYSSITNDLGWRPATSVEEGLRDCIDWYRPRLQHYL